jgi:hypothetical protein
MYTPKMENRIKTRLKQKGGMWSVLIWLRIGTSKGLFEHSNKSLFQQGSANFLANWASINC